MESKIEAILNKSGNNLHIDVATFLEAGGWDIDISSYYFDNITSKPREIDIVASRILEINRKPSNIKVILFIECKNLNDVVIFRTQKNNQTNSFNAIISSCLNNQEVFTMGLSPHHYLSSEETSVLYDTVDNQENRMFNAITQPVKALTHFKDKEKNASQKTLYYPLIVVNEKAKLYTMRGNDRSSIKEVESTIVGLNYSYRNISTPLDIRSQYFCIDLIKEAGLNAHLDIVMDEVFDIVKLLNFQAIKDKSLF